MIAQWTPYNSGGVDIDFWNLCFLSPADYFTIIFGRLLHVKDALIAYQLSRLIEQLLLLLGTYRLASLLCRTRVAVNMICIGAICSTVWHIQPYFNFRIYYLVPLALFFLVRFFQTGVAWHLWLAGTTFVALLLGNIAYFAPVYLLMTLVFCLSFSWRNWRVWRGCLVRSPANILSFTLFACVASGYLYLACHAFDWSIALAPGRDPATGTVPLSQFLSYGGHPTPALLLQMAVFGQPIFSTWSGPPDQTVYIGLLPLMCFAWAVLKVRSRPFVVFLITTCALLWLSAGGMFAALMYFFPGMSRFRHLGLLYSLVKILALFAAGFGMDDFLQRARRVHFAVAGIALLIMADMNGYNLRWLVYTIGFFLLAVAYYPARFQMLPITRRQRLLSPLPGVLLMGCYLLDMLLFNRGAYHAAPKPEVDRPLIAVAHKPQFQEERCSQPADQRGLAIQALMQWMRGNGMAADHMAYAHMQFDPCNECYRQFSINKELYRLAQVRPATAEMARVFGHGAPKLRLLARAVYPTSVEEALRTIQQTPNIDELAVITGHVPAGPVPMQPQPGQLGTVEVVGFHAHQLAAKVNLTGADEAWLVYADAYHPDWTATIDGNEVPVAAAYVGFKAVLVRRGESAVRFAFRDGSLPSRGSLLACAGTIFTLVGLGGMAGALARFPKFRGRQGGDGGESSCGDRV